MDENSEVYQKRDILLAEIHADLKHLVKNFDEHVKDDKKIAEDIWKKIDFTSKILYMGLGIVAFIEFGSRFIK